MTAVCNATTAHPASHSQERTSRISLYITLLISTPSLRKVTTQTLPLAELRQTTMPLSLSAPRLPPLAFVRLFLKS